MKDNLSVYIVTYNRAEYLKESIQSVLNQTYKDFNLYVLDNASTDNTKDIVAMFDDERLHYICHTKNIGGIENIKYAYKHCTSEYMVIFHDDDVMRCNMLEKEYSVMVKNPDCVIVSSNAGIIDTNEKCIQSDIVSSAKVGYKSNQSKKMIYEYLYNQKNLIFPSIMYRMSFINRHNIGLKKEVGPCADVVLYLDVEKNGGEIITIEEELMYSRVHEGQDSSLNFGSMLIRLITYFKQNKYYNDYLNKNILGQKKYFRWFAKKTVIRVASGSITSVKGKEEIIQMSKLLKYKQIDFVIIKFVLLMEKIFHRLFVMGYKFIKRRKR